MKKLITLRRKRIPKSRGGLLRLKSVLAATDFSPASRRAIDFAHSLGERFGADLHLVHVVEQQLPIADLCAMPLVVSDGEVRRRARRHLGEVAKRHSLTLPSKNIHIAQGRAFEEICRLAREREIDLIVTSTRGNTGFKHLALGSTAERVVRYSSCPVLVVPPKKQELRRNAKGFGDFRKILVPIDFSECSLKGLAYAKGLAKQFGAKIVLLHSIALQYCVTSDEYLRFDLPLLLQQTEKAARKQLCDLVEATDWDGMEVESSTQIGHAGEQICGRSDELGADAIVTSSHGRTGLQHMLLGSTAEYIVRHASVPVFVVPSREATGKPR